jgi:hypothetical protein
LASPDTSLAVRQPLRHHGDMVDHSHLDARSLALHQAAVAKIRQHPALFERVRATLARWREQRICPSAQPYQREWESLANLGMEACLAVAIEDSERARTLRQSTPFAGILDNHERIAILKAFARNAAGLSGTPVVNAALLAELAPRYAAGEITWRDVADETDASFGELLVELGRQGLQLPTCVATKRPAQQALFDEMLARAAASRSDESRHQSTSDRDAERRRWGDERRAHRSPCCRLQQIGCAGASAIRMGWEAPMCCQRQPAHRRRQASP